MTNRIQSPADPALDQLCEQLAVLAGNLAHPQAFPEQQLKLCAQAGVFDWFLPAELGGQGWKEVALVQGYVRLAAACLTTAFVITQRVGAMTRIAACDNSPLQQRLLPDLLNGRSFATIGISHLTTSRRHLGQPALRAKQTDAGFLLEGYSPWITGATHAQHLIVGAELTDSRQIIIAVATDLPQLQIDPPPELVALSASCTGAVHFHKVFVPREELLAGPMQEVMKYGLSAKTGGLQTSALALGLARGAIRFLNQEAQQRPALSPPAEALQAEWSQVEQELLSAAAGEPRCSGDELRAHANSLALRSSQAALAAAKGAGFLATHPAGRWCREALFFLVWSCPPNVLDANLCELAGMEG